MQENKNKNQTRNIFHFSLHGSSKKSSHYLGTYFGQAKFSFITFKKFMYKK